MNRNTSAPTTSSSAPTSLPQADEIDREFLLIKAVNFSALLNDTLYDRMHKAPDTEHESAVREGMIYLAYHIEDLLRAYIRPVGEAGEVANE
jgi:hypothetical protein